MQRNPYLNRSMIRALDQFVGRRRELERIMARIGATPPQSVSLVGERRVGKSSLLWHLARPEVYSRYLDRPERYLFAFLDLQGQQHLDREGFCRSFSQRLAEAAGPRLALQPAGDYSGIDRAVAALEGAGMYLVCLLDEFEAVTRNPAFGSEFFGFLRSLANAYPVAFVTSSRRELQALCHTREISQSPFFNIFAQIRVGSLLEDDARELIATPSRQAGLPLEPHAKALLALGGRLPFFLQVACSAAFECAAENRGAAVDWQAVESRFLEEATVHFRYLWDQFTPEERQVAAALAAGAPVLTGLGPALQELTRGGWVEPTAQGQRLFSAAFVRFVRDLAPMADPPPAVPAPTIAPGPVCEVVEPVPQGASPFPEIIGQSEAARRVFALMQRAAATDVTVLVTGETGTGKELVARRIHAHSQRAARPFVAVDCGAIAEHLQESELFGHRKGAFTDAVADREGLFEAAEGGTVFLDEIAETSVATQVKLLRVLQEGEVRRVGENRPRHVDVRLIGATNRHLEEEVRLGRFREDLYYRLYVLAIEVPPLRERTEDLPLLVAGFLDDYPAGITPEALAMLVAYGWPGNVRELANQLASARAMAGQARIEPIHLWPRVRQAAHDLGVLTATPQESHPPLAAALPESPAGTEPTLKAARDRFEREFIRCRLEAHQWRLEEAADTLGLSRSRLYELVKLLHLRPE